MPRMHILSIGVAISTPMSELKRPTFKSYFSEKHSVREDLDQHHPKEI
jgi:hypothetical protein